MPPEHSQRISDIKSRLAALEQERQILLHELNSFSEPPATEKTYGTPASSKPLTTSNERIALFTRLFRCRDDVFPKLWENPRKETKGYSPACQVEWMRGICGKPKTKCSDCSNRIFIPLDESAIRNHLEGKITIGTYTIREDDTCIFLAADFDKEHWSSDVLAFKTAAMELGVEAYIERSRSGNGGHAWIFFSEPVMARHARQLGTIILARAIACRHLIRFDSYDRFYPSQDTMPKGGFGNLIALPLQRIPRRNGNSVFVDDDMNPYADQWEFLRKAMLLSSSELLEIIKGNIKQGHDHPREGQTDPEIALAETVIDTDQETIKGIYTGRIAFRLHRYLEIDIDDLPPRIIAALKRLAAFANPKFFELQRMRFSTWNTPRYICCAELSDDGKKILLPRGLVSLATKLAALAGANIELADMRPGCKLISVKFTGELLPAQKKALRELLCNDSGVLVAPPGTGKTVIACALIAKRKLPTLILVHRKQLADQWKQRLLQFTNLSKKQIGYYDKKNERRKGIVDIGMLQALARESKPDSAISGYGNVIVDECHHIPAASFEPIIKRIESRYFLGLTATPYRKDGLDKIITMQCGPVLHTMEENKAQLQIIRRIIARETSFKMNDEESPHPALHEIWQALISDKERLRLVASDICAALAEGRFPLVLSDRKDHLEMLLAEVLILQEKNPAIGFLITSEMGKKRRAQCIQNALELIWKGQPVFLLSTGSLIGEGFDLPELCTLILAMPLSFKGRLVQYAGRLHRESKDKTDVRIYDYVDARIGLGITMFRKRLTTYKKMGYEIDISDELSSKIRR